ncbi:MAG TPA: beta-hydroxyacyl-ACP dehydratase [Candidatus Coprenecus stercoripullorum]|mgnify:CR=1 FL=1|nr:beta-hydroxyacyl-ACP dehydratase [Candidatus Coprenecus stercoripullorum]
MNREEIKKFLRHREPMLLVDEMDLQEDGSVVGKYRVKGDEFFLQGHFPGQPVVPGVILCEIMGQCSSLLIKDYLVGHTPLFTGIDKTRFKHQVAPGDTVEVHAHITNHRGMLFFIDAKAFVGDALCVEATLSFAIVDNDKINQ